MVTKQLGAKRARYCQWPSISREDESELRKRCANILQGGFRFSVTCKLCPQCGDRRLDWKFGLGRVLANTVGPFYPIIPVSACKDSRIKACQARVKIFHASIKPPRGRRRSTDMSDALHPSSFSASWHSWRLMHSRRPRGTLRGNLPAYSYRILTNSVIINIERSSHGGVACCVLFSFLSKSQP